MAEAGDGGGGGSRTAAGTGAAAGRSAVALLAGLADLGLETAEGLLGKARGLLVRSDLPDLAADAHADLRARGDVVLNRMAPPGKAHMEALAQRVKGAGGRTGSAPARPGAAKAGSVPEPGEARG